MGNNTRQVFHTQEFDYPEWHPILTAAINEKEESDSHLPRFFSVSFATTWVISRQLNFFDLMCSTTRVIALRVVFSSSEPKTLVLITPAM
jgi:hypothetical protein